MSVKFYGFTLCHTSQIQVSVNDKNDTGGSNTCLTPMNAIEYIRMAHYQSQQYCFCPAMACMFTRHHWCAPSCLRLGVAYCMAALSIITNGQMVPHDLKGQGIT